VFCLSLLSTNAEKRMRLQGKVAVITGAASGMGEVEARLFAREGAKVVLADLLKAEGRNIAADINRHGGTALFVRLDARDDSAWKDLMSAVSAAHGRLDILVNNAGIGAGGDPLSLEAWVRVMDVNAKSVFLGIHHAVPLMRASGGGSIVNITSLAATLGVKGIHMGYGASKAAVRNLTRSAAINYAADGIRVNSVCPGYMPAMRAPAGAKPNMDPAARERMLATIPLGREGRREDVAHAVLFLASDEAAYITGAELPVDGGLLVKG
jgi:NAD(P)-dependent dehydrogenase (short-subunit alcohol dehydrogenase family)